MQRVVLEMRMAPLKNCRESCLTKAEASGTLGVAQKHPSNDLCCGAHLFRSTRRLLTELLQGKLVLFWLKRVTHLSGNSKKSRKFQSSPQ